MPKISPRRRLPWDVLLLIFKQADPSTLAVLGRVSYDFLASTAPELYRDVEVTSMKQLGALFCERKVGRKTKNSSKHIRINPHLSLSQIRTLSTSLTSFAYLPHPLVISSSRIDNATPIPLDHLQMSFDRKTRELAGYLYTFLFPLLNPSRCSYKAFRDRKATTDWQRLHQFEPSIEPTYLVRWDRLEHLELSRLIPFITPPRPLPQSLGGLPRPALGRPYVVRLRLSHPVSDAPDLCRYHQVLGLDSMQEGSFILLVKTEEKRARLANVIRTKQEFARWKDVFAVEVAT